jgi:sorbitol-specific phosphotransferase system component IIBC
MVSIFVVVEKIVEYILHNFENVEKNRRMWKTIVECGMYSPQCGIFHIPHSTMWKIYSTIEKGGIRQFIFARSTRSFVAGFHTRVSTVRGKPHKIPNLPVTYTPTVYIGYLERPGLKRTAAEIQTRFDIL